MGNEDIVDTDFKVGDKVKMKYKYVANWCPLFKNTLTAQELEEYSFEVAGITEEVYQETILTLKQPDNEKYHFASAFDRTFSIVYFEKVKTPEHFEVLEEF